METSGLAIATKFKEIKMGCDITAYLEVKVNDRWEHAGEVNIGRNYELFGKMVAGHARYPHHPKPIADQRGTPRDINPFSSLLLGKYAAHTFSWLSGKELLKLKEDIKLPYWILEDDVDKKNIRLVFGFDS